MESGHLISDYNLILYQRYPFLFIYRMIKRVYYNDDDMPVNIKPIHLLLIYDSRGLSSRF